MVRTLERLLTKMDANQEKQEPIKQKWTPI
jgi:hypothetical protein